MELKDVWKLAWVSVIDLYDDESYRLSSFTMSGRVTKQNMSAFADWCFRKVSDQLGIPHEELVPKLKKANGKFYRVLDNYYKDKKSYERDDPALIIFEKELMVPDVVWLQQISEARVRCFWDRYNALTESEQAEFRARISD